MRMYDIIEKKKQGSELSKEEIDFVIDGYTNGTIPDYQMSALTMAIYFRGMNKRETTDLTLAMAHSGDMVDLSCIKGIKIDKHSTGGVGDKTTFVVVPIVASLGVKVAKMSGRGLGFTGGTIDKMESIAGFKTTIGKDEFFNIVNSIGASVIGQSGNLAPADKKIYALRDVTATVNSLPLIASSIMSKKIAAGSDCIMLDVKTGDGAFMKTLENSVALAKTMVEIGEMANRPTIALITDMENPLGYAIGNSIEMQEVFDTLKGKGPKDIESLSIELAANMLFMAKMGDIEKCRELAKGQIANGQALKVLSEMIDRQGGDKSYIEDYSKFGKAKFEYGVKSRATGYIHNMKAESYGIAAGILGAGREKKEDSIDFNAGIKLAKKPGDYVKAGETIAVLFSEKEDKFESVSDLLLRSTTIREEKPQAKRLIKARITKNKEEIYE